MAKQSVEIGIKVNSQKAKSELERFSSAMRQSMQSIQGIFSSLNIGGTLLSGANASIQEYMSKMRLAANLTSQGFSKSAQEGLFSIADNFERIGYSADQANDAFTQFITTGRATTLQQLGIYLDSNTKSILSQATAQERLNYVLKEGNIMFQKQRDNMPENIRTMVELKKATEDTKKALGQSFMTVINLIVNAFGGLKSTLTAFLTFYALYKSAMIISNTAIGISKALALGSVFAAPLAFGIGAAALSSLLAMGVGTGIAINSIQNSNIGENASNTGTDMTTNVSIQISEDRFGREMTEKSGNNNGKI